jgi:RNA recognition motif-containing protein
MLHDQYTRLIGAEMNIYVGNLSYEITDDEVKDLFSPHGEISSVSIIKDKHSGQSKGFGFIENAKSS